MNLNNTANFIYKELKRRQVPVEVVSEEHSLIRFFHNNRWQMLKSCLTERASYSSCYICNTKPMSEVVARTVGFPVPTSAMYESMDQAVEFMASNAPIVVKPVDAAHGYGVTVNIKTKSDLKKALTVARQYSTEPAILQKMVNGHDARLLIINGKYVAAVRRVPAFVTGDGEHTIEQLIEIENQRPDRKDIAVKMRGRMARISLDSAKAYLKRKINRIPKAGEVVSVVGVGNTSLGGHAEDITEDIPREMYEKAEAFAEKLHLPVCGVDVLIDDTGEYHFLEANASPGFGPHHHPRAGKARDVTRVFVDMLISDT